MALNLDKTGHTPLSDTINNYLNAEIITYIFQKDYII